jgi:hypothetical protein
VSRRIDDKTFEKFVQDVKSLRSIYTDAKIATLMKTNPGNFSSRINGAKRPGQDFIDRFYQVWGKKLKDMKDAEDNAGQTSLLASAEPKKDFPGQVLRLLNEQDERLKRIEESISRLDTAVCSLMERLVVSHQKLIEAHLSILSQQAK